MRYAYTYLYIFSIGEQFFNTICGIQFETKRGQLAIGVESYMKENGVTKVEAMAKFMDLCTNAWIDNNERC